MSDNPQKIEASPHEGGYLFKLRDGVEVLVKYHSETRLQVEAWCGDKMLPPDVGNISAVNFRKKLAEAAREMFGRENCPHIEKDLGEVARWLTAPIAGGGTPQSRLADSSSNDPVELLIGYAKNAAAFFHTPERVAYASCMVDGHYENYPVRSRDFRLWLRREFWLGEQEKAAEAAAARASAITGAGTGADEKPAVVREQHLSDALQQIESEALFESPEHDVFVRVAEHRGDVWCDLGDEFWRVVRITPEGWEVVAKDIPVRFVRPKGLTGLPEPEPGGDAEPLRNLLNLPDDDEGNRNWTLLKAWLVQAFLPSGPYPVLCLLGQHGSAKTTAGRILRRLVDPNTVLDRGIPRDEHNMFIEADSNWIVSLDNLSSIPGWLSDVLCRLSTGGGFSTRTLYENRDQELFEAMRPIILTGNNDVATRPDLLDRSLAINLRRVPKEARRREKDVYAALEEHAGGILGFFFDAVAAGLKKLPDVNLKELPRMADFAAWGVATAEALGGSEDAFLEAYGIVQDEAAEATLFNWPVAPYIMELAKRYRGSENAWEGAPNELKDDIDGRCSDEQLKRSKEWPKTAGSLSKALNQFAPAFADFGVHISRTRSGGSGRQINIFYQEPDSPESGDTSDTSAGEGDTSENTGVTEEKGLDKLDSQGGDTNDDGDTLII